MYAPTSALAEELGLEDLPEVEPRYNIAPTDPILGVRLDGGERVAQTFHWGLVPFWSKDRKGGARMINARAETAADKPAFREAMRQRRVLIPASGFYEWRDEDGKQPYLFRRRDGRPLVFAGLWERWWDRTAKEALVSATILVTEAAEVVQPIHDRMPVILPPEAYDRWLAAGDPSEVRDLLRPWTGDELEARRVSRSVNSVKNDGPELIEE